MSAGLIALTVIFAVVTAGAGIGFYAGARYKMDLEQWTVAGRGFGVVLVWLLMAGEIYTTFTFLGGSGWAYGKGAPAFYIVLDTMTKRCTVVDKTPKTDTPNRTVANDTIYPTREAAESAMKTLPSCKP